MTYERPQMIRPVSPCCRWLLRLLVLAYFAVVVGLLITVPLLRWIAVISLAAMWALAWYAGRRHARREARALRAYIAREGRGER